MKIGRADLLASLFDRVLIPGAVAAELIRYHEAIPTWLEVCEIANPAGAEIWRDTLDIGESEAIELALEEGADVLLIDERKGRRAAESVSIRCLNLPAVLILAKRRGVIPAVSDVLDSLEERGHFRLAEGVKAHLLREVGEAPGIAE
jgi:predicted nucleic acid-binding protein